MGCCRIDELGRGGNVTRRYLRRRNDPLKRRLLTKKIGKCQNALHRNRSTPLIPIPFGVAFQRTMTTKEIREKARFVPITTPPQRRLRKVNGKSQSPYLFDALAAPRSLSLSPFPRFPTVPYFPKCYGGGGGGAGQHGRNDFLKYIQLGRWSCIAREEREEGRRESTFQVSKKGVWRFPDRD